MKRNVLFTLLCLLAFAPGAYAYLTASPSFVYFSDTPVGGFGSRQSVTVRNNSNETVTGLNIYDTCFGDIQVSNYGCYGQLQPYGSCSLDIRFNPTREGYNSCLVRINSPGSSESVSVQGRGISRGVNFEMDAQSTELETETSEVSPPSFKN